MAPSNTNLSPSGELFHLQKLQFILQLPNHSSLELNLNHTQTRQATKVGSATAVFTVGNSNG